MAELALKAVQDGDLKITPNHHIKIWNHWMENIRLESIFVNVAFVMYFYQLRDLVTETGVFRDSCGGDIVFLLIVSLSILAKIIARLEIHFEEIIIV